MARQSMIFWRQLLCGGLLVAATCPLMARDAAVKPRERAFPIVELAGTEAVQVGATRLTLKDCTLTTARRQISSSGRADVTGTCHFSKTKNGKARALQMADVFIFAIEASEPVAGSRDCKTQIQGVSVSSSGVRLSQNKQSVATCLPAQWDQFMFQNFAGATKALDPAKN